MKRCGVCEGIYPLDVFPWLISDKQRYYACTPCRRAKQKAAYAAKPSGARQTAGGSLKGEAGSPNQITSTASKAFGVTPNPAS